MSQRRSSSLAADLLAIDVGNSKVEALLLRHGEERFRWRVPTAPRRNEWKRSFHQALQLAWQDMHGRVPILMASVAPSRDAVIEILLRRVGGRSIHRVSCRDPWPYRLSLKHPETAGADRLANVAGLVALGVRDGIAIDAGTAVTVDVLQRGRFIGGLILPGGALMAQALHDHTALLPLVDWRGPSPLVGDETQTALRAGIVQGLQHALAGLTQTLRRRLGPKAVAVITGGQAPDLAAAIPALRHEPDLLFLGLRLLAVRRGRSRRRDVRRRHRLGKKA